MKLEWEESTGTKQRWQQSTVYTNTGENYCPLLHKRTEDLSVSIIIFCVARIAELLRSPWRCSRVTELCWGKIVTKGMLLNGRRWAEMGMIGCQMAASSIGAMQWLEMCIDWWLWTGMMEQAVDVMKTSEVSDDQAGWWHEQDSLGMVAQDHAAHETPWHPPWSRHVVVDTANVELQEHLRLDCSDLVGTPDKPQR